MSSSGDTKEAYMLNVVQKHSAYSIALQEQDLGLVNITCNYIIYISLLSPSNTVKILILRSLCIPLHQELSDKEHSLQGK